MDHADGADIDISVSPHQGVQGERRIDGDQLRRVDTGFVMVFWVEIVLDSGVPEFILERGAKVKSGNELAEVPVIGKSGDRPKKELVGNNRGGDSENAFVDAIHDQVGKSFFKIHPVDLG